MKQFEKITINSKLEANPFLLFVIWLFLIILPYLILSECIDRVLKQSENRLLTKSKIQLLDEVNEFRTNLTSSYYLETKMKIFPNEIGSKNYTADSLSKSFERYTSSKVAALFYYDNKNDFFDAYIDNNLKNELGLYSKYSMKNLLLTYALKINEPIKRERSISYFQNFLSAAGGINFKANTSILILSGKANLGRMLGYFKTFGPNNSNQEQMLLCLIREKDIPLKEIIENATNKWSENSFKREVVSFESLLNTEDDIGSSSFNVNSSKEFYKFKKNDTEGLSIISVPSDEMLLRIGSLNTFYPLNVEGFYKKYPAIKVSLSSKKIQHPMRETINRFHFPVLIVILFISFGLIRIGIFGYTTKIRILGRVILCVLGAVVLPFTSFSAAAYYNQYFSEEYSDNEIEHYTKIQTEVINKAIEAYIGDRELAISELRERLNGLSKEEFYKVLYDWFPQSGASVISYNYIDDDEIQIPSKKGNENKKLSQLPSKKENEDESLSQFGKDAKDLFDIGLRKAFEKVDFDNVKTENDLKRLYGGNFMPNQISAVVTNIGKIYASVPNEPNCLYSLFPVYQREIIDDKVNTSVAGSVLIKFDTYKIMQIIKKRIPSLFHTMVMGKYTIRNAVIPLNSEGLIPSEDKMFTSEGLVISKIIQKVNQIYSNKSNTIWTTKDSINTGTYLNLVNAIVVCRAEKAGESAGIFFKKEIVNILIYILLMITALSVMLGSVIVSPIRELQKASENVAKGDYSYKIETKTGDEFESLSEAFNEMTEALLQKEKMTSYVSKDVLEEVSGQNEQQLQPSGERIPVCVLFCALSGEKELSKYSPEEVTRIISCLIDAVDDVSSSFNGQVDKLIEDTVMVVFRRTSSLENITLNACRAALAINSRLKNELPGFKIKMGIASGDAVSGKIGSRNGKLDYTVIGNPVNLAARLKVQAEKAKNTGILVCPNSIRLLQGAGRLKFIERMTIKGRTNRTFPLYELLGLREY